MNRRVYCVACCFASMMFSACDRDELHRGAVPMPEDSAPAGHAAITVAGGGSVERILLCRDSAGVPGPPVERFHADDNPLHAVISLAGVDIGTTVRAEWVAVDAGGEKEYMVAGQDLIVQAGGTSANFTISLPRPWPPGIYRIDVHLNGQLARSLEFEIGEAGGD